MMMMMMMMTEAGSFFYHSATSLRASTRYVSDRSKGEFRLRLPYETYHTRILFNERYVRMLTYSILAYAYPRAMLLLPVLYAAVYRLLCVTAACR